MQEPQGQPVNRQSEVLSALNTEYDFTAPTNTIPIIIERSGRRLVVSYVLTKPTSKQLYDRENAIVRQSEEVARGETTMLYNEDTANAALFNQIVQSAEVREVGADKVIKALSREECLRLPNERKSGVIKKMYRARFEVVTGEESDDLGFLFEDSTDEITVRQTIGDPAAPDFTILYCLRRPTQAQRDNYNMKAAQVRSIRGVQGGKGRTRVVTNLKEAETLFNQLLDRMEGARGEAVQVDAIFKAEVVATAIQSYEDESQSF